MSYESVLVWMLSLNREYSQAEYDTAYQLCKLCFPGDWKYEFKNPDSFRMLMTQLLPVLMMRHRRVPRARWQDHVTQTGKHWIEHLQSDQPGRQRQPCIGYQLTYCNSLCGMAVTQGLPAQVVNIGLGIKQMKVEPKGITIPLYLESLSHKLTQLEISNIMNNPDEIILKRLCIMLALKDSYIKAIGQPVGFDYSRLEFDMVARTAKGDGLPLNGWEFRIFTAKLGVARGTILKSEDYECVCAYYRGTPTDPPSIVIQTKTQEIENWVQFINIDQLMTVSNKLAA